MASRTVTVVVDTSHLRGQLAKAIEIVHDLAESPAPIGERLGHLRHRAQQWVADEHEQRRRREAPAEIAQHDWH